MCVVAVLVAVPGSVELLGTDFKKNPSKSVTRDQPAGIEASVPGQPTITPAGAAALAYWVSGGILGFCQICGNPEKTQEKISEKISNNLPVFRIFVVHSLALDIN